MTLADAELLKETKENIDYNAQEMMTVNFVLKRHKYMC